MLRSGLVALGSGDLQRAEEQLGEASRLRPDDARIWLALAQTRWKLSKDGSAAAAKARKLGDTDPVVLGGLALFYTNTGDAKSAIEVAQAALKYAEDAHIRNLLGKAYEAQGAHADAVRELAAAVKDSPYEESFHFDLVQVHLRHQEFALALQVLDASTKVFARSPQLELARGVAYYGQRRFGEAADAFLKTIDMAPDVPQPYLFLARVLDHAEDRWGDVLVRFRRLANANPNDAGAQFLLGKVLAFRGEDLSSAEAAFRHSITLNEKYWESHYELGLLLDGQRKFANAAKEFERSIELSPDSAAPHYRLARVYERLGRKDDARVQRELHAKLSAEEKPLAELNAQ